MQLLQTTEIALWPPLLFNIRFLYLSNITFFVLDTGWEKAENESAAFKSQLDVALQQKLATEDRVKHLDGALKEVMKQLRNGREEQEQRIHETIVKKTREYDKLRAEMESKLDEASEFLAHTRTDLIESRAENKALTHALQVPREQIC